MTQIDSILWAWASYHYNDGIKQHGWNSKSPSYRLIEIARLGISCAGTVNLDNIESPKYISDVDEAINALTTMQKIIVKKEYSCTDRDRQKAKAYKLGIAPGTYRATLNHARERLKTLLNIIEAN